MLPIPSCDEPTRDALLEACKFNWSAISPAIFGSMFQNVMTPAERRHLGAHYTTEENILKTIRRSSSMNSKTSWTSSAQRLEATRWQTSTSSTTSLRASRSWTLPAAVETSW